MRTAFVALTAFLLVGCGPSVETRGYAITVENRAEDTVTLWLTKTSGSPYEREWSTPEDVALTGQPPERAAAIALPPGAAADIPGDGSTFEGQFGPNDAALLRIYSGGVTLSDMLATSPNSDLRQDVTLPPGRSRVVVEDTVPLKVTVAGGDRQ